MEQTRIYPLAQKKNPLDMIFRNGSGVEADMLFHQDYRYFEMLAEFVAHEYVGPEDWAMRGMMASSGIAKGKAFAPDDRMREILSAGADVGVKMAKSLRFGDYLPGALYYRAWHHLTMSSH